MSKICYINSVFTYLRTNLFTVKVIQKLRKSVKISHSTVAVTYGLLRFLWPKVKVPLL